MSAEYSLSELIKFHLDTYYSNVDKNENYELETRFNTKGVKTTRIQFEKVIQLLKSKGFSVEDGENGMNILKIQNEYMDENLVGNQRISKIRVEIEGITSVQDYCKTNDIKKVIEKNEFATNFQNKTYIKNDKNESVFPVDVKEYNLRVSYQKEVELSEYSRLIKDLKQNWNETKKIFRYMNRTTFVHPMFPFKVDMSIVKSSTFDERKRPIPVYKIEESGVFSNPETFEIEIELDNTEMKKLLATSEPPNSSENAEKIKGMLLKLITFVLSGMQNTPYPQPYPLIDSMKYEYLELIYGEPQKRWPRNKDFCGPSSLTLQMVNLQPLSEDTAAPNIRKMYSVTDKADGDRKLLFINKEGLIYLINTNMDFQFTGTKTTNSKLKSTILDGEHILHNKNGGFINLYAAFDVYFVAGRSIRDNGFIPTLPSHVPNNFRLPILQNIINSKTFVSAQSSSKAAPLDIKAKKFKSGFEEDDIFKGCDLILKDMENGLYPYNTDGLIFTPLEYGVGCTKLKEKSKITKTTWELSFKWKPPEHNTIDFLISTEKTESGDDIINNIFKEGTTLVESTDLNQFKIIKLRCGFDERNHGYINPCNDVYMDNLPSILTNVDQEDSYKAVPFYPSNPSDPTTHICHIPLKKNFAGDLHMMTEEGEVFYDGTIVEFKYDKTKPQHKRWIPIKVRYDKTAELKRGGRNFGNPYHVANSNWYSIHNPISTAMLKLEEDVPSIETDHDVYYNRNSNISYTESLRQFHNLVVKYDLIKGVSKPGDILIDFAVGKAGDFSKWISSKLSFVFGLDISKDNIENRLDGACARFLNNKKQKSNIPYALFVQANSSLNIRDGSAMYNEKDRTITKAIFGDIPKDTSSIGPGIVRQYGKGSSGFSVSSCQFALHYFFENKTTLSNFINNVSQCTKIGGHFIGTCYDGNKIFKDLNNKDSISITKDGVKIWEITKDYTSSSFPPDETSVGLGINVYQETINKVIKEYLVNFDYFIRIMENYGFRVITEEEAKEFNLPNGIGNFEELYNNALQKQKRNPKINKFIKNALNMSFEEKKISFYNNYFVFVKISDSDPVVEVEGELVSAADKKETIDEEEPGLEEKTDTKTTTNTTTKIKKKPKKIRLVKRKKTEEKP
tara:strand:- start:10455 stop:13841 length:3387 start_codon:yes stop_codon:yes gene_type:complete